jgi:DNA-directed RNA polymerase specialized sigma subunit
VAFEEAIARPAGMLSIDILAFDEALTRLAAIDSRKARVLEFWFFAGMTVEEIARTMEIGTSTVSRDLEFSKVWLARELRSTRADEPSTMD